MPRMASISLSIAAQDEHTARPIALGTVLHVVNNARAEKSRGARTKNAARCVALIVPASGFLH